MPVLRLFRSASVPRSARGGTAALCAACAAGVLLLTATAAPLAQTDLDAFMQQVLAERDSNWRKLQQFVLDEREQVELRGPSFAVLWGERRDFTWFIRDGFFVRSPVKVNGTAVSEADRVRFEADYLRRAQERERRQVERERSSLQGSRAADGAVSDNGPAADAGLSDVDGIIRQTRQPQFISSAYFLRFAFDAGRYAFVGREQLDGRDVLRIEYYPEKLFSEARRREQREDSGRRPSSRAERRRAEDPTFAPELYRLMNQTAKITLWIEPSAHQILKYTFDDLDWNFFPGQWLAQMDGVTATMTMGQPFPDVWLPRGLEMRFGLAVALGRVEMRYTLEYDNYRQPDVRSKIGIPDRF